MTQTINEPQDVAETAIEQMMLQMQAQSAYDDVKKSPALVYAIWWILGIFGGHRFYLRHYGVALLMFFTLGGFGIGWLVDVFFLGEAVRDVNARKKAEIFGRVDLPVMFAG